MPPALDVHGLASQESTLAIRCETEDERHFLGRGEPIFEGTTDLGHGAWLSSTAAWHAYLMRG